MQVLNGMDRLYLYTRFERFWHWAQAGLVMFLSLTGLEVHGSIGLFGFQRAAEWHNQAGIAWLVLYTFIIFWKLTTGEWKQYIPTTKRLFCVVKYYTHGIFKGEPHPAPKSPENKHNPLQRLTYLSITVMLIPLQMATGFLYYTYNSWPDMGIGFSLGAMAAIHIIGAFGFIAFLVVHLYMITTGHGLTTHLKAMFTGWEEVPANGAGRESVEKAA